jgi:hypothetical protein
MVQCDIMCEYFLAEPGTKVETLISVREVSDRYEATFERKFFKALHELERLQMARKGERPPAPLGIDIDVSQGG